MLLQNTLATSWPCGVQVCMFRQLAVHGSLQSLALRQVEGM